MFHLAQCFLLNSSYGSPLPASQLNPVYATKNMSPEKQHSYIQITMKTGYV